MRCGAAGPRWPKSENSPNRKWGLLSGSFASRSALASSHFSGFRPKSENSPNREWGPLSGRARSGSTLASCGDMKDRRDDRTARQLPEFTDLNPPNARHLTSSFSPLRSFSLDFSLVFARLFARFRSTFRSFSLVFARFRSTFRSTSLDFSLDFSLVLKWRAAS